MKRWVCVGVASAFSVLSSVAVAETLNFEAALTPAAEVPSVSSAGSGEGTFSYDTVSKELMFTVTFRGLGSSATGSHIHGPAAPTANADIMKAFAVPQSPISGQVRLTTEQEAELVAGQLYVDVHTDAQPQGEIRGQIVK